MIKLLPQSFYLDIYSSDHKIRIDTTPTKGPGNVCVAPGIDMSFNGLSFLGNKIRIEEGTKYENIFSSPIIGVGYAKEGALLPWRFFI